MNAEELLVKLGVRLVEERKRLGYTQAQLAEYGKVKRVTQYLYEQGDRYPNAEYLVHVCSKGIDINYVLLGSRIPQAQESVTKQTMLFTFRVIDEICRDDMGRLLDLEYRAQKFCNLMELTSDEITEETSYLEFRKIVG